jgi:NifU-like protein involved in Fe-S cluster formation
MSADPYNEAVRERFANPRHAGDLQPRYPDVVTAEASESGAGISVGLAAELNGDLIRVLRYRTFGCPHLIAAAEEVCRRFEGQAVQGLQEFSATQSLQLLEAPVDKTGRLLLLEDAVHALARAISAREPTGATDNRRN